MTRVRNKLTATALLLLITLPVLPVSATQVAGKAAPVRTTRRTGATLEKDGPASAELRAMIKEDQDDRAWFMKGQLLTDAERDRMIAGDAKRLARVRTLLQQDKLVTAQDFDSAALLFQHGVTPDDILIAHELAFVSLLKAKQRSANNLPVLAEDRFLERIGRKQRFGSQGQAQNAPDSGSDGSKISDVDEDGDLAVTDALRADLFMPPLAASKKKGFAAITDHVDPIIARLEQRYDPAWQARQATRPVARELQRLAVQRDATEAAVVQVLTWYRSDDFRTPSDYANAATVLLKTASDAPTTAADREITARRLLLAHELAMVAALRKHPAGSRLFAQTWDRFLVTVGHLQRYGTYKEQLGNRTVYVGGFSGPANRTVQRLFGEKPVLIF